MVVHRSFLHPALRAALLVPALALPAAAGVGLRLDEPKEPLASGQEATFIAEVTGAGRETGVLWSASEVIERGDARTFRGIWPWSGSERFEPDGAGARATFAAPGRAGGSRLFQIRAAAVANPKVFRCIRVWVQPGPEAPVAAEGQPVALLPGGSAGTGAAGETKAAAAPSREAGLAWETPFRLGSMGLDDEFEPAVFRFQEGQPCLVGEYRRRYRGAFVPARMAMDNEPRLLQDPGPEAVSRPTGCRSTLDALADGSAVLAESRGSRIWKVDGKGGSMVLAGTGHPPDERDLGGAGLGGPARDARLRVAGRLAACPDESVAWYDAAAEQIRRVTPEGILEALAGGGAGPVFAGDGQDLEQERPALGVRLVQPATMVAGPAGSLVLTMTGRGVFALAADGVLHRLMEPSWAWSATVTEDGRVVFTQHHGFGAGHCPLFQMEPGREPVPLATFMQARGDTDPLVSSPSIPLGLVRRMLPAPGGGLLVTTQGRYGVWYLSRPGEDLQLVQMVNAIVAAVRDGDLDLPWRCRETLARVAGTDPARPGGLRALRLAAVAKQGQGLRGARTPEGKALAQLPDPVQNHVVSFLQHDQALALRARIALHVLDRKLAALPEDRRAAFAAYRPAGAAGAGLERQVGTSRDGEGQD